MTEKTTGYVLLVIGILVILFSALSVYQVFTNKAQPALLFNLPAPKFDLSKLMSGSVPQEFRGLVANSSGATQELFSAEAINQPLNLYAHLFLMGFIASIGFKLASLGVMLLRPIEVKVKEANQKTS